MVAKSEESVKAHESKCKVVQDLIAALESGEQLPWVSPLRMSGKPRNVITGHIFTGSNVFLCLFHMTQRGFTCPLYINEWQAKNAGIWIKREEWSHPIRLLRPRVRKVVTTDTEGNERVSYPLCGFSYDRYWNLQQTNDDWESRIPSNGHEPLEAQEAIAALLAMPNPPSITWGTPPPSGEAAGCYFPALDQVCMWPLGWYNTEVAAAGVLAHELVHSTGHQKRLGRKLQGYAERGVDYSLEEVIAEAGAALLCHELGIEPHVRNNNLAYMQHWAQNLREDPEILWEAFSAAQLAADYILGKEKSNDPD